MNEKIVYADIFSAAWKGLKSQIWLLAGLLIGFTIIYSLLLQFAVPAKGEAISISGIIVMILCVLLEGLFVMGYLRNCLQTLEGEEPQFSEYGKVSRLLLRYLAAWLLTSVMMMIGLALFILPGIYLVLRFQFVYASIVDEDVGILTSFKRSWRMTKGHVLPLLVILLIQMLIITIGILALGIGIFVAVPLILLMYAQTYKKLIAPATL